MKRKTLSIISIIANALTLIYLITYLLNLHQFFKVEILIVALLIPLILDGFLLFKTKQ